MDAMAGEKKVFDVGPGELKVTSQRGTVLRTPVLGSCIALFMYDVAGRVAGLAHVMFPSSLHSGSTSHADIAVRELAGKLTGMGSARGSLRATLVCRDRDFDLSRHIIDSIKAALAKEKIELQAELFAQSKISASAEMNFDTYAIACSSRYGLPSVFLVKNRHFDAVLRKVRRRMGFDLRGYKASTLVRRMGLRMARAGAESYRDYSRLLDKNPAEFDELLHTLAINVTGFFRDPQVFESLRKTVLPALASRKRKLRAWSAGCSTGEEAYSLAMLLEELREKRKISNYSVLATDLSKAVLEEATEGIYGPNRLKEIPPRARKFARNVGGKLSMPKSLKRSIKFQRHDLTSAVFPKGFDLILCRNVLIFYERDAQQKIVGKLASSLAPHGYLVLGSAEASIQPPATLAQVGKNIYKRKP